MKQFLLYLDETCALGKKFIIQDLDDTHVFILAEVVQILQERVGEAEVRALTLWCQDNNLLNFSKTKEMIVDCREGGTPHPHGGISGGGSRLISI
ncbi:General transcription factor IIH subunit 5 [Merluccius polli]|uniref:General transcription and DNA repair factor IIH subunit TFB5 n=1 Tax=Merluccius polli TaxID=89951 RepID=A0AA47MWV7_MERPO|nr:General transcription factor IIH subunit 5 [Merluccius polli]